MPMLLWTFEDVQIYLHDEPPACPPDFFAAYVCAAEMARAKSMQPARAHTFLATRMLLRQHLAERLHQTAPCIAIEISPSGRPFLADYAVSFSLSHSHGKILIGLASGARSIGVDIQFMDPTIEIEKIATRFFDPAELEEMQKAKDPREKGFEIWALKEARYKCRSGPEHMLYKHTGITPGYTWAYSGSELVTQSRDAVFCTVLPPVRATE